MLELKITGTTTQELLTNALQVTALLLHGAKGGTSKPIEVSPSDAPAIEKKAEAVAEPAKPGRKPKAKATDAKQIDLEQAIAETKPKEMPAGGDAVPDMTGKNDTPAPTFNDCKTALVAVYDNYIKRAKDAGETDEDKIMAGKIAYAKKLVYGFGIQKLMDLKPEQYADFIAKAKPYIDGTAKVS